MKIPLLPLPGDDPHVESSASIKRGLARGVVRECGTGRWSALNADLIGSEAAHDFS